MVNRFFKVMFFAFALLLPLNGITQEQKLSFENQLIDAVENNNASIVRLLLQQGADPNSLGRFKTTALHRAAFNNFGNIADLLIASGADLNAQDLGGATPLHIATRQGNAEIVSKLIQAGASPNIKDNEGYTSINKASASRNEAVITALSGASSNNNISNINNSIAPTNTNSLQPVQVEESFDNLIMPEENITPAQPSSAPRVIDLTKQNNPEVFEIPAVVLPNSERAKMMPAQNTANPTKNQAEIAQQNLLLDDLARENISLETQGNVQPSLIPEPQENLFAENQEPPVFLQNEASMNANSSDVNKEVQMNFYPANLPSQAQFNNANIDKAQDYSRPASFAFSEIARKQVYEKTNYETPKFDTAPSNLNIPKFNYQKYQASSGLFTMPVDAIQVVRLDDRGTIRESKFERDISPKIYPKSQPLDVRDYGPVKKEYYGVAGIPRSLMSPAERRADSSSRQNNFSRNLQNQQFAENIFEAPATPVYNQMKAVPIAEVQIDGEVYERRPVASNIPANSNWQPTANSSQENLIDNGINDILSQPASSQNIIPNEYANLPREANFDSNKLTSSINTFYNEDGSYDVSYNLDNLEAERQRNLELSSSRQNLTTNSNNYQQPQYQPQNIDYSNNNINVPKSMAGRMPIQAQPQPQAYRASNYGYSDYERAEYPRVEGNFARGPKSIQFWRSVPEERKGQLYSRIIQQNAPIISPVRKVETPRNNYASKATNEIQQPKFEEVKISVEPEPAKPIKEVEKQEQDWKTDISYTQNTKVPEVAVAEEEMPKLDEILAESDNIPEPPMPDDLLVDESKSPIEPKPEPKIETPQAEDPSIPRLDEPKLEEPKLEDPKLDEPKIEAPQLETSNSNAIYDYSSAISDVDLSGTHSVIGVFDTAQQAVEYFNKISLRLGLLYNYKVVQSISSNKFMLAVGKLEDETSANKVCEVYSSSEASCQSLFNQKPDSVAIADFKIIESKKVYSMIGEFTSEDETREFFKNNSSKFNVDYKIIQNPENNIYLLQVGPLFNGGDGKNVCDEMKAPNIKCRVTLK